jgi:SAM-dependent methyltransferase
VVPLTDFVLSNLPLRPARVLEVGCGRGDLARTLDATGYDVTAIDPVAPEGPIFRRLKLEELDVDERFDAVVASQSFHHITNLEVALDRVLALLGGAGRLILDEFAWDRLDQATADWYEKQRRVLLAARRDHDRPSAAEWDSHHAGNHTYSEMHAAIEAHFDGRFEWVPHLYRYLGGVATPDLEESLIDSGAIQAVGFRFVGVPR